MHKEKEHPQMLRNKGGITCLHKTRQEEIKEKEFTELWQLKRKKNTVEKDYD